MNKGLMVVIFSCFILIGFLGVYTFWPDHTPLPQFGEIEEVELESIYHNTYDFQSDKIKLVAFFYARCPDICPMTFRDLQILQSKLQEKNLFGTQVEIITITLDPEVDSKDVLLTYSESFQVDPAGWHVLRTSLEETKKLAKQFKMPFKKEEDGVVTHGTTMYLVDQTNQIRSKHNMAVGEKKVNIEEILENINTLVEEK
ncbi:SCO family protein [Bacillus timonensis]|nr:SCO family protein [Bacillus timonensis]